MLRYLPYNVIASELLAFQSIETRAKGFVALFHTLGFVSAVSISVTVETMGNRMFELFGRTTLRRL